MRTLSASRHHRQPESGGDADRGLVSKAFRRSLQRSTTVTVHGVGLSRIAARSQNTRNRKSSVVRASSVIGKARVAGAPVGAHRPGARPVYPRARYSWRYSAFPRWSIGARGKKQVNEAHLSSTKRSIGKRQGVENASSSQWERRICREKFGRGQGESCFATDLRAG